MQNFQIHTISNALTRTYFEIFEVNPAHCLLQLTLRVIELKRDFPPSSSQGLSC